MRSWLLSLVVCTGCMVPRSMVVGQMAAPVGRGATEVGVFAGVQYATQTDPPFASGNQTSQYQGRALALPGSEVNVQHGFSEQIALNVHGSPAGIQPGVKWTINRSRIAHIALLPEVAFGYGSFGSSVFSAGANGLQNETNPTANTSFLFLAGLKVLFSHRSGFFAGVGYDFNLQRAYTASIIGVDRSETITVTTGHQLSASVGLDIALGWVHIRPEVAFAVTPGIAMTRTARVPPMDTTDSAAGGFGFAIFPGFSIAVASPPRAMTADEREEEEERKIKRRRPGDQDDDDDDDADDEDEDRPGVRRSKKSGTDDEEEAPRRRRRSTDDDDEDTRIRDD